MKTIFKIILTMLPLLLFSDLIKAQQFLLNTLNAFTGLAYSSAAWGDYDNDGDLDFIIAGQDVGGVARTNLYKNNGNSTFTQNTLTVFPGVVDCSVAWGDYDNDGDLDLLITGWTGSESIGRIYRNNGNSTFTNMTSIPLTGVRWGAVAWGDYDNDGDLDILLTGLAAGDVATAKIYRNNGNHTFTQMSSIQLTPVWGSSIAWGDYDNDGDLDILMNGYTGASGGISKIYKNNGNSTFAEMTTIQLIGTWEGPVKWIDYDSDGDLDILLMGTNGVTYYSRIYKNNGNGTFTFMSTIGLTGTREGSASWGDYDNDGDLDVLLTGLAQGDIPTTKVYRNNGNSTFTEMTSISLVQVGNSSAIMGDYDNDNDLDILIAGNTNSDGTQRTTSLYYNNYQYIAVTSPNGGETWVSGNEYNITWTDNISENVKIDLYKGGVFNSTIIASTPSDGTHPWIIPLSQITGSDYRVRITSVNTGSLYDDSNSNFTIKPPSNLTLSSPNGGENWPLNSSQTIEWTSENVSFINIEISRNNGATWAIIDTLIESTGIYNWLVSGNISNQCKIKISNNSNNTVFDISDSSFKVTPVVNVEWDEQLPTEFLLSQNYPNPFNPTTIFKYSIPNSSQVTLKIFNTLGEEMETLVNEERPVGTYELNWNAANLPSGVYFYKLQAGEYVETKKMILLK